MKRKSKSKIHSVLSSLFLDRQILSIEDRGIWIRHNFRITLDNGEVVFLKIDQDFPASEKEAFICELLTENGLPAPDVIALDTSCGQLPSPFIIQKQLNGTALFHLLESVPRSEIPAIYRGIGRFYRKLHSIHYPHPGWIDNSGKVLDYPPNHHQFNEVIVKIAGQAVGRGLLSGRNYERLQQIWSENLNWLDVYTPSLVGSSLPWCIYLAKIEDEWQVIKIMDLMDLLYWDPAWDITNIRFPSFVHEPVPECWEAFIETYGVAPPEKRMKLYLLMQRIDAGSGNYIEPARSQNDAWKTQVWNDFDSLLDEIEALS